MSTKNKVLFIMLFAAVAALSLGAVTLGASDLSLRDLLSLENRQILHLRMARVFLAAVAGAGLAVCGAALQAILRNPLAEPYLLGTSSGAGLASVAAVLLGVSRIYVPFASFLGAAATIFLVYSLARQGNRVPVQSLILSGVILSVALSGAMVFLISISNNEALHGALWWLWGSTQVYDMGMLFMAAGLSLAGGIVIYVVAQDLNAISIGEEEAQSLGVDTEALKKVLFFVTAFVTAGLVSICGIIGFVGLVIPHMVRLALGANHKVLIPFSALAGAGFMIVCDVASRMLCPPLEVPIGVITACVGAPVFIVLLKRSQRVR